MRALLVAALLLCGGSAAHAHSTQTSTTVIAERAPGEWTLQLDAALAAFAYEVHTHYGDSAYADAAGFEALVAAYCRERIRVAADGSPLSFGKADVRLGHTTTVTMALEGVPASFTQLEVANRVFADVTHSRSIFVVAKRGVPAATAELTAADEYTQAFDVRDGLVSAATASAGGSTWCWISSAAAVLAAGLAYGRRVGRTTVPLARRRPLETR